MVLMTILMILTIITSILVVNLTTKILVTHITTPTPTPNAQSPNSNTPFKYRGGGEFALLKRKYSIPPVVSRRNRNILVD